MSTEHAGQGPGLSEGLGPLPPNAAGSTLCAVRWVVETPSGWLGAWDREAFDAFLVAAVAAERERCAKLCETTAAEYRAGSISGLLTLEGVELAEAASGWALSMAEAIRAFRV